MVWRGAWAIARNELVRIRFSYLWNLIMCLGMFSIMVIVPEMKGEQELFGYYMMNLAVLMMLQLYGFGFSRSHLGKYWTSDIFTKRTSFLKIMPVSNVQIVLSRLIPIVITTIYMYTLTFGIAGLNGTVLTELHFRVSQYIALALVCVGYTIMISGLYLYLELGFSGKVYFITCSIIALGFILIVLFLSFVVKQSVWNAAAEWVRSMGWWAPAISIVIGAATMGVFMKLTERRLNRRDLYL